MPESMPDERPNNPNLRDYCRAGVVCWQVKSSVPMVRARQAGINRVL